MPMLHLLAIATPPTETGSVLQTLLGAEPVRWLAWAGIGLAIHVAGWLVLWVLVGRDKSLSRKAQQHRALWVIVVFVGLTFVWLALIPAADSVRNLFLTLFGVGITGLITLSSTTLAANFMAGLMLRQVGSFKVGDFVRIDDNFGRVSGRGAFHVELQTEDRDLLTLPNAYLISKPLRVVRSSGTMVTCGVSIGYDVAHEEVERVLLAAAGATGLSDPHVLVLDLLDHAVSYRVAGFLQDVESILSTRSRLRKAVLAEARKAGMEIVSPRFMNQRPVTGAVIAPEPAKPKAGQAQPEVGEKDFEKLVFDKAEDAQRIEQVEAKLAEARARAKELATELKAADAEGKPAVEARLAQSEGVVRFLERLHERLEAKREESE